MSKNQPDRSGYPVGTILRPGDRDSFVGKPSQLHDDWRIIDGTWLAREEFPELAKHPRFKKQEGRMIQLPNMLDQVVSGVGGERHYQSEESGFRDGYQEEKPAVYPIIKVK